MPTTNDFQAGSPTHQEKLISILERIARAQEGMLAVAMEARGARMELSKKLQEKLQQPFEGK
jgi:hypothetical protein